LIIKLERNVRKNWRQYEHKNSLILIPPKASKYALCIVLYLDENSELKKEYFESSAIQALIEKEHVQQCLVIGMNIDHKNIPYHFIAVME